MIQVIKQGLLDQKDGCEPVTIVIGQNPIIQEESCSESSDDEIFYGDHSISYPVITVTHEDRECLLQRLGKKKSGNAIPLESLFEHIKV